MKTGFSVRKELPRLCVAAFAIQILLGAAVSLAEDNSRARSLLDGRDVAAEHCATLPFASRREECVDQVRRARYMDVGAVQICKTLTFASNLNECLSAITDKEYLRGDLLVIEKESFDSQKIELLKKWGRPYFGGGDDEFLRQEVRESVSRSLRALDRGDVDSARLSLARLLDRLDRGGR